MAMANPTYGERRTRRSNGKYTSTARSSRKNHTRFCRSVISFTCLLGLDLSTKLGVHAQGQTSTDPRDLICLFDNFRTIVSGDTLFVDGGEWAPKDTFRSNGTATSIVKWQNEYLWRLDFTKSFNASKPPWEVEKKPSSNDEHYNGAQGVIWDIGDGTFTTVGGWFSPYHGPPGALYGAPLFTGTTNTWNAPTPRMFKYDPQNRTWSNKLLPTDVTRVSTISWTSSQRLRRGWTLGGLVTIEQANTKPDWMVDLDKYLNTMTEYSFINDTWETSNLPDGIGATVDGELISLDRVGDEGVLLFLAGEERWTNETTLEQVYQRRSMETIWIYDVASKEWYEQPTSGTIPPGRRATCSVMVPAADLSSYQIYVFSGTLANEIHLLDLYVLSVPSFIWTKIDVSAAGYPDTLTMSAHECALHAGGRQMLIVPGTRNASLTADDYPMQWACNLGTAIRVFDTEDWVFRDTFDPTLKEAKVPQPIIKLIGGNGDGGATVKSPKGGWASGKQLETIFAKLNQPIMYDNGNITSNSTSTSRIPSPTDTNTPSGETLPADTIAGIAVGCVAGIVLVALLIYCVVRRRKDKKGGGQVAELQGPKEFYDPRVELGGGIRDTPQHELDGGYEPEVLMEQHMEYSSSPPGEVKKDSQEILPTGTIDTVTAGPLHLQEGYYEAKP